MIELRQVDKYFNRNKSNEIHVINNVNLELPNKGLVTFFGESGCGKTTLLNVIGGLEYPDSGRVFFDKKEYSEKKIDIYRLKNIGFIAQSYLILPSLTVFDNLDLVLRPFDLTAKEKEERIEAALDSVGMLKLKKRPAGQLSGGQQQRVAIARALVKSPSVIIADEPTGNLDEANTLTVMNIIRKLAENCLVILVTHEERIAYSYSDRIIRLLDGKIIKDELNKPDAGAYVHRDENQINIHGLEKEEVTGEQFDLTYFYKDKAPKLQLRVAFHNDTFFIEAYDEKNHRINLVNPKEKLFIDREINDNVVATEDNITFVPLKKEEKLQASLSSMDAFKMGHSSFKGYHAKQKLMMVIFFISTALLTISSATIGRYIFPDRGSILTNHTETLVIKAVNNYQMPISIDASTVKDLSEETGHTVLPDISKEVLSSINLPYFTQMENSLISVRSPGFAQLDLLSPSKISYGKEDVVNGQTIEIQADELILDKLVVNAWLKEGSIKAGGLSKAEDLIGKKLYLANSYSLSSSFYAGKIAAISNTNQYVAYVSDDFIYDYILGSYSSIVDSRYESRFVDIDKVTEVENYHNLNGDIVPLSSLPEGTSVVPQSFYDMANISSSNKTANIDDLYFEVDGYYDNSEYSKIIQHQDTIDGLYYKVLANVSGQGLIVYNRGNQQAAIEEIYQSHGYSNISIYHPLSDAISEYRSQQGSTISIIGSFGGVSIIVGLIFLYFVMRSSMIRKIYEIGVYRSLGIAKGDIRKIFDSEIFFITIHGGGVSFILSSVFLFAAVKGTLASTFFYPWWLFIVTGVLLYAINFVIGRLAMAGILGKSPADIIKKHDI
ncbi:MAG TPA: ABC transporter ATP-binding protein/permease [Bacilli bacterium]|nr:ABC transporter ATP-binding protein/permease [Bacilli bacterium]